MGRSDKKPRVRNYPTVSKEVVSRSPSEDLLSWRVALAEIDGPWPWAVTAREADRIRYILSVMEQQTWGTAYGKIAKTIPVANLSAVAQKRLIERKNDDIDDLVEFRLGGLPRMWGIRRGTVCHLLWWDPRHEVCPSRKKHT